VKAYYFVEVKFLRNQSNIAAGFPPNIVLLPIPVIAAAFIESESL
jgi:hypothetical protein